MVAGHRGSACPAGGGGATLIVIRSRHRSARSPAPSLCSARRQPWTGNRSLSDKPSVACSNANTATPPSPRNPRIPPVPQQRNRCRTLIPPGQMRDISKPATFFWLVCPALSGTTPGTFLTSRTMTAEPRPLTRSSARKSVQSCSRNAARSRMTIRGRNVVKL